MSLSKTQISQLYVSIFNRASEKSGSENWLNSGYNTDSIAMANAMLATDAAKAYFGSSLDSDAAFVEHIYANTLNKGGTDVDAEGKAGWVEFLETGASRGEMVALMIEAIKEYQVDGAKYDTADQATKDAAQQFENRVKVSDYTADTLQTIEIDEIDSILSFEHALKVTSNTDTATAALTKVEDYAILNNTTASYTITNGTLVNSGYSDIILKDFGFNVDGFITAEGQTASFVMSGTIEQGFSVTADGVTDYIPGFDFPDVVIHASEVYYFDNYLPTHSYVDIPDVSGEMNMEVLFITTVGTFTDQTHITF